MGCDRTMSEIKAKYEDIHPAWPEQPPEVEDNLPPPKQKKAKKKLCPRYYKQCFKTDCGDTKEGC